MKKTALLFSGQGAQYVGMGKDLYSASSIASSLFDIADEFLGNNFKTVCFEGPEEILTKTSYCQPALYVHGLALWKLLENQFSDLKPVAAAGLSLGEFTAHSAVGHFSFKDGLRLVHERGRLMQEACEATGGGMLTLIGATPEQALTLAEACDLQIANLNCPGQIVLSGAQHLISKAQSKGREMGLKRILPLKVAGAYHSRLMQSAQDGLKPFLEKTEISSKEPPVYANVSGTPCQNSDEIHSTLLRQVTGSVLWQTCIENMVRDGIEQFIELGPKGILGGMCKRTCPDIPCISLGTANDLEKLETLS